MPDGTDDGSPNHGVRMAPRHGNRIDTEGIRMGRQVDVVQRGVLGDWNSIISILDIGHCEGEK